MSYTSASTCLTEQKKMGRLRHGIAVFVFLSVGLSCSSCTTKRAEEKVRPLVYEGMPVKELEDVLGEPERKESEGKVYDANSGKTKTVSHWYYSRRTVTLINDTVVSANSKRE